MLSWHCIKSEASSPSVMRTGLAQATEAARPRTKAEIRSAKVMLLAGNFPFSKGNRRRAQSYIGAI